MPAPASLNRAPTSVASTRRGGVLKQLSKTGLLPNLRDLSESSALYARTGKQESQALL